MEAAGAGGDGYEARLKDEGIRFKPIPLSRKGLSPVGDLRLCRKLYAIFRRERPVVVHAFTIKPAIYATLAAAFARVPVRVVTITGLGHAFMHGKSLLQWFVEFLYWLALRRADVVIFQNHDDRDQFLLSGLVATRKVRLVAGSGVDLGRFNPSPLPFKARGSVSFLMVARLLREKGVVEFVRAAEIVRSRFPEVRCSLVGGIDPRNPSSLGRKEFEELNSRRAVTWLGETSDVRPHIADADVIVLPSYREGLPRSLLEGAAMGRALLATDAVGCRDVVQQGVNGYLVPVGDACALAEAMVSLLGDHIQLVEMGRNARKSVESKFDEETVIEQTIAIYNEVISEKVGNAQAAPLP